MPSKRTNAEEIIHKRREADVLLGQGQNVSGVCKQPSVSEQTYDRWRTADGGMQVGQAKRRNTLEAEHARRRRAVADLTVDKLILKAVAAGRY